MTTAVKKTLSNRDNITHTIYGQALMTANSLGLAYTVLPNTTLNERFSIQAGAKLSATEKPAIRYIHLGTGAHDFSKEIGKPSRPELYKHRTEDAGLYEPFPFVLRALNDDLTVEERKRYRLRCKVNYNGVDYIAYYGRLIDFEESEQRIMIDETIDGVTSSRPFTAATSNLYPTRPELPPRGVVVASNLKLRTTVDINIDFTAEEVAELANVANIIYGDESYGVISEIAICSGVDRQVTQTIAGNGSVTYTEVVGCQIAAHFTTFKYVPETNTGFKFNFDLGSRRPLVAERSLDTTVYYTDAGLAGSGNLRTP